MQRGISHRENSGGNWRLPVRSTLLDQPRGLKQRVGKRLANNLAGASSSAGCRVHRFLSTVDSAESVAAHRAPCGRVLAAGLRGKKSRPPTRRIAPSPRPSRCRRVGEFPAQEDYLGAIGAVAGRWPSGSELKRVGCAWPLGPIARRKQRIEDRASPRPGAGPDRFHRRHGLRRRARSGTDSASRGVRCVPATGEARWQEWSVYFLLFAAIYAANLRVRLR